jgi:hypothetical protein
MSLGWHRLRHVTGLAQVAIMPLGWNRLGYVIMLRQVEICHCAGTG